MPERDECGRGLMHRYARGLDAARRLILVRHCEASGQGPDAALTSDGVRQAEILRDFLADERVDRVVCSEFVRAQQSAGPLAASRGLRIHVDARLNERTLASTPIDNWQDILRHSFSDPELRGPGGESAREVLKRAWGALNEVWMDERDTPVVVSHGNLISLALHSIDESFGYAGWERLTNPDVYVLEAPGDGTLGFRRMWG